jgi:hypothetical protein
MESTSVVTEKNGSIGGWLLLPASALCLQPVFFVLKIVHVMRSAPSFGGHITVIWPVFWFDILMLSMVAIASWAFFRKRSVAPCLFVAYVLLMWICWAVISGVSSTHLDNGLIAMLFHLIVLLPYMVFSRRVAATFVLAPDPRYVMDRLLARISMPFENLRGFLRRQRWLAAVHIILFLTVVVFLNSAVRSLWLNGNLSETWRLIAG